jgi:hypothetical protein
MKTLMITWTDIFEGTGTFFQWCFKGMRLLGQGPNIIISLTIIFLLTYWCLKIVKQNKEAERNGTYK